MSLTILMHALAFSEVLWVLHSASVYWYKCNRRHILRMIPELEGTNNQPQSEIHQFLERKLT